MAYLPGQIEQSNESAQKKDSMESLETHVLILFGQLFLFRATKGRVSLEGISSDMMIVSI